MAADVQHKPFLSRDEVRQFDRICIETLGISGQVLMENASRGAADWIARYLLLDEVKEGSLPVGIVCGGGNNAGDGFAIARRLATHGIETQTLMVTPAAKLSADARANLDILMNLNLPVATYDGTLPECRLWVDAIGGTGIEGPLRVELSAIVDQLNAHPSRTVSIDIPTGMDCDTGEVSGSCIQAAATLTFVSRKVGFENPSAARYLGEVHTFDIGVPPDAVFRLMV
jgi:NAD(P)H-hydrate epimerase